MGALAPLSSWIPEDDLLLKNAVEAGASLESLAKGAVQFSRKFTVRELQERWHSLLYDPIVSAEAAFHMIEFERSASTLPSKFSKSGNSKESKSVSGKRKAESIRNCYYALRKRIRNEPFNTMDLSFLIAPTDSNFIGNEDEPFSGNCILEDPVSTHFGLQGTNLDIMHHSFPEIGDDASAHALHAQFQNTIGEDYPVEQDIVHEEIPHIHGENIWDTFSLPCNDDTKNTCLSEYDVHGESSLKLEIPSEEMKNVNASTEGYLAELSNSLLNFTNEEELLFTDVDGKDAIDKSYYDGLSSLLLNSPNDISQERMPDITEPDSSLTPDYIVNQCGASHGELDEDRGSDTGDVIGHSEVQLPELCVEVIICTLNTEDPEIPCNDDIVFTNHLRPKSFSSVARRNFQDSGKSNSSTVKEFSNNPKTSEGGPILVQRDVVNPGQSHLSSQMIRSQVKPEIGSHHPVGDHGNKFDLPSSSFTHMNKGIAYGGSSKNGSMEILVAAKPKEETPEVVPVKHFNHNSVDSSIEKPVFGPDSYKCHAHTDACGLKQDPDAPARIQNHQPAHAKLVSAENAASEQVVNYPVSDPEEPPIESDDDIPYFSDIEAMILDMDLDPEDQDLYLSEEVSRYQHEDTKRVIMRLEQGAQSYMQRAIALQGAFAVLYGRRSKHYIKKSEVLLGRATEDVIVDIDLGREGRANKVSRKQATINLDKSGSFHLKNIGKCSISVNDKEMAPGQSLSLTSSCLIEIRGMPFIFETNQACVKQYLDGTMQKNQTQVHQF
ncbi:conserved hypothetical protein [Ricinus communis]|uniref:FHA domain-containing protein n=1 Tax=Ricinus communis TaxID=3988 RepID=B9R830_RICCO|nr:conserved hypothetical protein [Ricinus communis]